jgi:hypothetical protein
MGNAGCKEKRSDPLEALSIGPDPTHITHHRSPHFAIGNNSIRATKLSVNQFRMNLQLSKHSFFPLIFVSLWFRLREIKTIID